MGIRRRLLIFVVQNILLQLLVLTISEPDPLLGHFCNYDYYSNDTTSIRAFRRNLAILPSFLTSNTSFYNFTIGLDPDTVNVIALCRGNIGPDTCRTCLNNSNTKLQSLCPHHKESIIWYENCMLRYSTLAIFNTMNIVPNTDWHDNKTAQDVDQFNEAVTTLLDRLGGEAAVGDSVRKFAIGNKTGPNMNVYGMVQCTPDLTFQQCSDCLGGIIEIFPRCCYGKVAASVLAPSCRFRYKLGPFNSRNGVEFPDAPPPDDGIRQSPPRSSTGAESTIFTITNNCPFTICPSTLTNSGQQPSQTRFELAPNASSTITASASWNGRIWARSFCTAGVSYTCMLLRAAGASFSCMINGASGNSPVTLVEFSLDVANGLDFFDISLVDGFNLPVRVVPSGGCQAINCSADINADCPRELALRDQKGDTIGCKTACMAFDQPEYCCEGEFSSSDKCKASIYSSFFKEKCPQAYSTAFDDATSTFTCATGTNYLITFCP